MNSSPSAASSINGDYAEQWNKVEFKYLVRLEKHYIVFLDGDLDVDWQTTEAYDNIERNDENLFNAIMDEFAYLDATPCLDLSMSVRLQYKRLLGEAVSRCLARDFVSGRTMLTKAARFLRDRSEETSRLWYLCASTVMAGIVIAAGLIVWISRAYWFGVLGHEGTWLWLATVAGSSGALLSVIGRSGKLKFDCSAGKQLHYLEGASRIWTGGLSGFLVGLAVSSGFVLAPLASGNHANSAMMVAAFAAGAGERLATSIISKFQSSNAASHARELLTNSSNEEQ